MAGAQLGQAQGLLKGQPGVRGGDAAVSINVTIGQADLLGGEKRGAGPLG